MSEEDGLLPEPEDNQNKVNRAEESQIEDHQVEENHAEDTQTEGEEVQDTQTQGLEDRANSDDKRGAQKAADMSLGLQTIAGAAHQEVLKAYTPIRRLIWNDTDTLISFLDKDVVHLVDSASHTVVGAVEFPGVLDYSMFIEEDGIVHIIAGSKDGTIAVWDIPYKPSDEVQPTQEFDPHFMNSVPDGRGVDLLAFSDDSNYIAEFFETTDELGLHYKLRYTNELISKKAEGSASNVYTMAFSDDNNQLATATTEGKLLVWNAFNGRFMYEHDIYAQSRVPVHFIQGTYNLLAASAENTVVVLDPTGTALQSITTSSPVIDTKMLSDKRRVAILTQDNRIEIYNLEDGVYLGYVPSFNITAITSFDFNSTDTSVVMGHEDGSIYKIDLQTNVLPPRTGPVLRLIGVDEVMVEGAAFTPEIPPAEYSDMKPAKEGFDVLRLFPEPRHSVDLMMGTTFLPDPFVMSLDMQLGYVNSFLIHPFYVGAFWRSSWGFPQRNFPYVYHLHGVQYDPPLLIDWALEFPIGLSFVPWDLGLEISMEVAIGFAMHELWNRKFGHQALTAGLNSDHFHGAFVTTVGLGMQWKGILFKVTGEWDSEFGWTGQFSLGYSFRLPAPDKWKKRNIGAMEKSAEGDVQVLDEDTLAEESLGGDSLHEEALP